LQLQSWQRPPGRSNPLATATGRRSWL